MSSPLAVVLCTTLLVILVSGGVIQIEYQPKIVDSVKVAIVSKQDGDGKWVNEVKLEHGADPASWTVEVEQKTLELSGRQSVQLTATLTGPKPTQQATAAPRTIPWRDASGIHAPYPEAYHPSGSYHSGSSPSGSYSSGSSPSSSYPSGSYPVGSYPVGSYPSGSYPGQPCTLQTLPGSNEFGIRAPSSGDSIPGGSYPGGQSSAPQTLTESRQVGGGMMPPSSYSLYIVHADWLTANKTCADEGAHLAIINSEEESSFLTGMLHQFPGTSRGAFIGITDEGQEGNWVTIYGVPVESTGFARWFRNDQPDNANGIENCGSLSYENGGFNDVPCTGYITHAICEKEDETADIKTLLDSIHHQDARANGLSGSFSKSQ